MLELKQTKRKRRSRGRQPTLRYWYEGRYWTIPELEKIAKVHRLTLRYRLRELNWPVEEALFRPPVRSRWERKRCAG